MTKREADIIATVIRNGASIEGADNVRDMCEELTEADLGWKFEMDEENFNVYAIRIGTQSGEC